jgi:hypothetical protein
MVFAPHVSGLADCTITFMSHRLLVVRGSAKPADTVVCSLRFSWFTVSDRASASLPSRIRFVF